MLSRYLTLLAAALISATVAAVLAAAVIFAMGVAPQFEHEWTIPIAAQFFETMTAIFVVTLAHAIVLGLPLFLLLRSRVNIGIVTCALGGLLVGAIPAALLSFRSAPTVAGWTGFARGIGFFGLFGLAGGIAFWTVMRASLQAQAGQQDATPNSSHTNTWGLTLAAVLLTGAIFILPGLLRDTSCHNMFRDGRTSAKPQLFASLDMPPEDWTRLTQIFTEFAAKHSLDLRNDRRVQEGKLMWRHLSLCNEAGINIKAVDQPWLGEINSPIRGIQFSVFELQAGSDWAVLARDLLDQFAVAWPEKIIFRGPGGENITEEAALKGRR